MPEDTRCSICGSATVVRTAKKGPNAGLKFHVCSRYPECKGRVPIPAVERTDIAGQGDLGEAIFKFGSCTIYRDGIIQRKGPLLLWENVEQVFIGGERDVFIIIPLQEKLTLTVIGLGGWGIHFEIASAFLLGHRKKEQFFAAYDYVLSQISKRQWEQFLQQLDSGQRISFNSFDIAHDGIYHKKLISGYTKLELPYIYGYELREGKFYLLYIDIYGKVKKHGLGAMAEIPNIHIAQAFIDSVAERNIETNRECLSRKWGKSRPSI